MISLLKRKEPVIAYGDEIEASDAGPALSGVVRTRRRAPTGDLTRSIRRDHSKGDLDRIRRSLALSPRIFEAISDELLSHGGPLLGAQTIEAAMGALFDFEPLGAMAAQPVVLVGGTQQSRMRTALSLSQKIERTGRCVALYSLVEGAYDEPQATYRGGLDILHLGSAEACVDAVQVKEPADLAIVEASCLDAGPHGAQLLAVLSMGINAEIVYVYDESTPVPDARLLSGIARVIFSGRPTPEGFGALLDAAYANHWAFAGKCTPQGIFHTVTAATLADRFGICVR